MPATGSRPSREAFDARRRALERYEAWERQNPASPTPQAALRAVGRLYDLLPPEARRRPVDPSGVRELHRALSVLKAREK